MSFAEFIETISQGNNLSRADAAALLTIILDDSELSDDQIADALTRLTEKTVTAVEVCGFIDAMRARMTRLDYDGQAIDMCGTGGDKSGTFNISTAAAIVIASGGVAVAKHGNRAATSKCGSADVLEALGVAVDLAPSEALKQLIDSNFTFLFAPMYHPSLKRLAGIRRQLGFPTIFNLLGPLLNPAGVKRQVIGTFSLDNARLLAEVVSQMDYEHAIVLNSEDGLDEASLASAVSIFEIKGSVITQNSIQAKDYGLEPAPILALLGGDAAKNAAMITTAFQPAANLSPEQRSICFNAGLGFYVAGKATTIELGIDMARKCLQSGHAAEKLVEISK